MLLAVVWPALRAQEKAQEKTPRHLADPFDFPLQLSGAFCDLRANHFHAGIDIRTKGVEGHAVHAVQQGYVARLSVSPWGYGLAVYLAHPDDSLLTVYGHLQRFNERLTALVREKQYENESYAVDFSVTPGDIPVAQGDIIAYSGNSGSSGGPHLHFEVRDMANGELLDPLAFYHTRIRDTQKPQAQGLMVCPVDGKGMANGSSRKQFIALKPDSAAVIEAWGEVGLGINAVDRMDGSRFSCGVKDVLQTVDGVETYRSYADRFSFEETGFINSYVDYEEWSRSRTFYIKTFIDPGCHLRFTASRHAGILTICEERSYLVTIALTDIFGNTSRIPVIINGKKQDIAPPDTAGTARAQWYDSRRFEAPGLRLAIPRNSLYSNINMRYHASAPDGAPFPCYSAIHTIHHAPVPLHEPAQLSLCIDSVSRQADTTQFGIVGINLFSGRIAWTGGVYRDGWITAGIHELGRYAVARDTVPPEITPVEQDKWQERRQIKIRIADGLSGISAYRGEIDGRYALFALDGKKAMLTCDFDGERSSPGDHRLTLTVTDQAGNRSELRLAFRW